MKLRIQFIFIVFSTLLFGAFKTEAAERMDVSFFTGSQTGKISGYLQTPDGGVPGRTDRHRPTFAELDIDDSQNFIFELNVSSGQNSYRVSTTLLNLENRLVLQSPLLSQWIQFDVGEDVKADIKLNQYGFAFFRSFELGSESNLQYSIGADIVGMDFHYKLYNSDKKVDRSYMKASYRIGGALNYVVNDQLTLGVEIFDSVPFPNTVQIASVDICGRYDLWQKNTAGTIVIGISYYKMMYRDEQEVPNYLLVENGPMLRLGLVVKI